MSRLRRNIRRFSRVSWVRVSAFVVVIILVFSLGILTGDGRLRVGLGGPTTANPSLPDQLDYSTVNQVYNALKANYDGKLTTTQLLDGLKKGLAESADDPYTVYFNPSDAKQFANELNNSFSGIGAELGKDDAGNLIVVSPIKGFPADKAGLQAQDVIVSINGESTADMQPDTAATKIRGPKGTQVTLKVVRAKSQTLTFTITRDDIQLPSVNSKILDGNIGYMQITSFSTGTTALARSTAQSFKDKQVKGVILDLRGDPGGILQIAIDVSSIWLPEGKTIVTQKGTYGEEVSEATGKAILANVPTVVLVDGGSASASEITAGALHDNKAAYLIGVKTFGKGIVQQLINLNDGSELKVTVASWYRPNGQNINKKGITPDQTVQLSDDDRKAGNDPQLTAAEAYLNK